MATPKTLRVHTLAKELGVTSKEIIEKCRAEGIELKNHMAAISAGLAESIREWFSGGGDVTSVEVGQKVDLEKVRRPKRKKKAEAEVAETQPALETAVAVEVPAAEPPPLAETAPPQPVTAPVPTTQPTPPVSPAIELAQAEESAVAVTPPTPAVAAAPGPPPPAEPVAPGPERLAAKAPAEPTIAAPPPAAPPPPPPEPIRPAGPQLVPKPAELRGPRLVRVEAPEPVRPPRARSAPASRGLTMEPIPLPEAPSADRRGRGRGRSRSEDEGIRIRTRSPRRHGELIDIGERVREWHDQDLLERKERLAAATGQGLRERRAAERRRAAAAAAAPTAPGVRKAPIELEAPITLKDFCTAAGVSFATVSKKLLEHTGTLWTINQSIDADTLELLALDLGLSVVVAKKKTALEKLQEEFARRELKNLQPRPPVVTMLGHVDHGKTSLLDAIRKADVARREAGGITQHIGAYRVDYGGWQVTFLDTPGHEAFTAMRARGANLTDVVVLVVAADDGVMPQTIEAINHAKAAGVPIVVALNKIDLPNIDLNRIYAQLAEQGLVPTEWGGDTDVIKTSAVTGVGIDDLVAHLSTLSELLNLKADPDVPAHATVIEAQMREGYGPVAQVLVRQGTLQPGQVVVCGGAYGRIRTLCDDRGRKVDRALPGWPVEVIGLDELPEAGDQMYQVDDLKLAKEIAEEIRRRRRDASLEAIRKPRSIAELLASQQEARLPELNLIVKADVQGSVDVLRKALSELPSEKAQLRLLHAAVGAISEADVNLARASNAIIFGFHVAPEERARQLAEELGVEIRLYRVIYELLDDARKALAGLLEPVRREEVRGSAEVRQIFNITRVGVVAGCLVNSGVLARQHRIRVIRDGRIVAEDRTIASLRRFKDDVREVRAGLECGVKIDGFDDLKPGDMLEAYEVVEVAAEL